MIYAAAVLLPLFGAVVALLFGRQMGTRAARATTIACMGIAAGCGIASFIQLVYQGGTPDTVSLGQWINAGTFHVEWAVRRDTLASVMVAMVTTVSTLIHIYSVGYMAHEKGAWRFFSYLSLFTFAMLMLVTADNLLQLFFGWEGVGLASYLLIGYWYYKKTANDAAMKAFIVNRVADLFFAVGIALIFFLFGSVQYGEIFSAIPEHMDATYHVLGSTFRAYEVIGVLLFIGAMGKSAQIGFHVWLPDAMEGPTPVSALIHAATMVTAGVFLMSRMSPLMDEAPGALSMVTFVGGTTALFAATVACVQNDIKRVIAYSTCSQLGYMFVAAGVGAYQASMFHLLTHAFFKALLFLGAGSVIHAMSDEQDMRKMGGIWKLIPLTYVMMWIGSLALGGVWPFDGYYSKDAIIEAAWGDNTLIAHYGFWTTTIAAFLTAFYSWRLLILTFHGRPRASAETMAHVHESPAVMTLPLMVLAVGAMGAGWYFRRQLIGDEWEVFWNGSITVAPGNHALRDAELAPEWVRLVAPIGGIIGIVCAYVAYMFVPAIPGRLANAFPAIYRFLLNKWYFDELYAFLFVRPARALARSLWQIGDARLIDGMPNGLAAIAAGGSAQMVRLQTGSIAVYAFVMLIGLVSLIAVFLLFLR